HNPLACILFFGPSGPVCTPLSPLPKRHRVAVVEQDGLALRDVLQARREVLPPLARPFKKECRGSLADRPRMVLAALDVPRPRAGEAEGLAHVADSPHQ